MIQVVFKSLSSTISFHTEFRGISWKKLQGFVRLIELTLRKTTIIWSFSYASFFTKQENLCFSFSKILGCLESEKAESKSNQDISKTAKQHIRNCWVWVTSNFKNFFAQRTKLHQVLEAFRRSKFFLLGNCNNLHSQYFAKNLSKFQKLKIFLNWIFTKSNIIQTPCQFKNRKSPNTHTFLISNHFVRFKRKIQNYLKGGYFFLDPVRFGLIWLDF